MSAEPFFFPCFGVAAADCSQGLRGHEQTMGVKAKSDSWRRVELQWLVIPLSCHHVACPGSPPELLDLSSQKRDQVVMPCPVSPAARRYLLKGIEVTLAQGVLGLSSLEARGQPSAPTHRPNAGERQPLLLAAQTARAV